MLLEIQVSMDEFGGTVVVAIRRQVVCAIPAQHPVLIDGNSRHSGDRVVERNDQAIINGGRAAVRPCSTWLTQVEASYVIHDRAPNFALPGNVPWPSVALRLSSSRRCAHRLSFPVAQSAHQVNNQQNDQNETNASAAYIGAAHIETAAAEQDKQDQKHN